MSHPLERRIESFAQVLKSLPELRYAGDLILREQTQSISEEEGIAIGEKLASTLKKYRAITNFGRGLAAPQIGENKSVFVTYIDDVFETFINPRILERSHSKNFYRELCMSAGILAADVERSEWVLMEWTDEQGAQKKEKFEGFKARLVQHEEAHLRGLINLDEARPGGIQFATFDPLAETLRQTP